MCGCEEIGASFCDFGACTNGNCASCESFQTIEDCDKIGMSNAGARDCKLRCFNFFERDFAENEFYCG